MRDARCVKKKQTYFHDALNKYGFENFKFNKIDAAHTQEDADNKERFWIMFFDSTNDSKGYNLDSGGQSGGVKSEKTKKKIGLTTVEKWRNPGTAERMMRGLLKGAESMKKKARRYPFVCPTCGGTFYYSKFESQNRKYCSLKCSAKAETWRKGIECGAISTHENNVRRKNQIKKDIIEWAINNKDVVLNCPYNRISNTLYGLKNMLIYNYNIKDFRSVFICFDNTYNLKTFLDRLKEVIITSKENIC